MNKLDQIMQDAVDNHIIAGMNLLILKDGKEMFYGQAGYADIKQGTPYARDSINRIYSMTKPVTAAAVMILMERGKLSLLDPIEMYIPEFANTKVYENGKLVPILRPITIRDLLSMSSGLLYGGDITRQASIDAQNVFDEIDDNLYTNHQLDTLTVTRKLAACGLAFQPGEKWEYGTSADVLGGIVEVVSGMRFGEFLQKEFFDPLEMVDTGFYVPLEKIRRMPTTYESIGGGLCVCETNHLGLQYLRKDKPAFESGGAGLTSTLDDYSNFATMLMNKGAFKGRQILQEWTVSYMTKPQMIPRVQESLWNSWDTLPGMSYGNLLRMAQYPNMANYPCWEGEYGWDGWLGTYFCNSPKNRVTILSGMQHKEAGGLNVIFRLRAAMRNDSLLI